MFMNHIKRIRILQVVAIIAAAVCIFIGAGRGEISIVLRKAVRICLECIGVAG